MASSRKSQSIETGARVVQSACAACVTANLRAGHRVVVGLSGGIDSIVLLHALNACRDSNAFGLSALHVHHGLSSNADGWDEFCRKTCARWGIPYASDRVEVERKSPDGLEAAARRARHDAFGRAAADFVVLGHHCGDQAETVLFNLVRGCGVAGAAAMAAGRGHLLRPLLNVSRTDIAAYAAIFGLKWVDDESNANPAFSRNFLRHDVLAPLKQRFPAAEKNLAAAAARFREVAGLLDDLAHADLGAAGRDDFPVPVSALAAMSEPRARNVLRYLLARRNVRIPSEARLKEALRQMLEAAPDRHPRVHMGAWDLVRRRGEIALDPPP